MTAEYKHRLLSDLAAAHVAFKETILHVPEASASIAVLGEWSIGNLICHLSSWDELLTQDLRRIARGDTPILASFRMHEVDDWNASLMRGRREFSYQQAINELEECYDDLVEELETIPESMVGPGDAVSEFITSWIEHLEAHASHVREWREGQGL
jgi:hypothetical protein